jgi:hypothetical protein
MIGYITKQKFDYYASGKMEDPQKGGAETGPVTTRRRRSKTSLPLLPSTLRTLAEYAQAPTNHPRRVSFTRQHKQNRTHSLSPPKLNLPH